MTEEGFGWNRWILGNGVAPLYLELVDHLMQTIGTDGYYYWPAPPSQHTDAASKLVATAFWTMVATSSYHLYPPQGPSDASGSNCDKQTLTPLKLEKAIINLLEPPERDFFLSLLLRLGVRGVVTPNGTASSGLKEIQPQSMISITPQYLLNLIWSTPMYCEKIYEIWKQESYSMDWFNQLLSFITRGTSLGLLIHSPLLPLANHTLGTFCPRSADQFFLVAKIAAESEVLGIAQNLMVHPSLYRSTVDKLIACGELNIKQFQFEDILRLQPILEQEGISPVHQKDWLEKFWLYFRSVAHHQEQGLLSYVQYMRIYFGNVVGEPPERYVFISPSEFNNFTYPAIVAPSDPTGDEISTLQSLEGLIQLNRAAFPQSSLRGESSRHTHGIYRLLKSIDLLARRSNLTIEAYIMKSLSHGGITARYLEFLSVYLRPKLIPFQTLRKFINPAIISDLLGKYSPSAKEYLTQLPIWPVMNSMTHAHRSATTVLLPPHPDIAGISMTNEKSFVEPNVAKEYGQQLEKLGAEKMTVPQFLHSHVGVIKGAKIAQAKKASYPSLIKTLSSAYRIAFSDEPLGVDGNGSFCMLKSLYHFDEPIFKAAFRDLEETHFLHPDYRKLDAWQSSPLLRDITQIAFLACARSIHRRARLEGLENLSNLLVDDAKTVFGYLRWDFRDMLKWSSGSWRELPYITFVPVKTVFTDSPSHRIPRMRQLIGNSRLTSLVNAVRPEQEPIAWSQCLIMEGSPGSYALRNLPTNDITETVLEHLIFLSENRNNVTSAQIPDYVKDITASYKYLSNCIGMTSRLSIAPGANVWFNINAEYASNLTIDDFQTSWTCSKHLCFELETDSYQFQPVRSFLAPYRNLLKHCGIKSITAPVIPVPSYWATDHASLVLSGLQELRREGQSFDLSLVVEGEVFNAHSVILFAVSKFWRVIFSKKLSTAATRTYVIPDEWNIKPGTVKAILDYIYDGRAVAEDFDSAMDQLHASHKWQLHELNAMLEAQLLQSQWIHVNTIHRIQEYALLARAKVLVKMCDQYISNNWELFEQQGVEVDY